jgi:hypothetical protein
MWTRPPAGVNFTAFVMRFQTTCWSLSSSPRDDPELRVEIGHDLDPLRVGRRARRVDGGADDGGEVHGRVVDADLARDDARDVEDVLDELSLRLRVPVDDLEPLGEPPGVGLASAEQPRPAEDGLEGRSELVRDRGQELVFQAVQPLGVAARLLLPREQHGALLLGLLPLFGEGLGPLPRAGRAPPDSGRSRPRPRPSGRAARDGLVGLGELAVVFVRELKESRGSFRRGP